MGNKFISMNKIKINKKYILDKNIFDLDKINTVTIMDIITTKKLTIYVPNIG